jgi:hypothetical protein
MMSIQSTVKVCGGTLRRVEHASTSTGTTMIFSVFTPPTLIFPPEGFPALYWYMHYL